MLFVLFVLVTYEKANDHSNHMPFGHDSFRAIKGGNKCKKFDPNVILLCWHKIFLLHQKNIGSSSRHYFHCSFPIFRTNFDDHRRCAQFTSLTFLYINNVFRLPKDIDINHRKRFRRNKYALWSFGSPYRWYIIHVYTLCPCKMCIFLLN